MTRARLDPQFDSIQRGDGTRGFVGQPWGSQLIGPLSREPPYPQFLDLWGRGSSGVVGAWNDRGWGLWRAGPWGAWSWGALRAIDEALAPFNTTGGEEPAGGHGQ